jgi:hypothetical protein
VRFAQRLAAQLVCRRTGLYAVSLLLALAIHVALLIWQAQVSIAWIALGLLGSLEGGLIVALAGRCRKKPGQAPEAIGLADEVTSPQAPATLCNLSGEPR